MSQQKSRIAVVGLGKMGLLHSCILNVIPDVKLAALCDKSYLMRKICGKLYRKVKVTDDVQKLAELDLDAVYVTTPIPSHFAIMKSIYENEIAPNLFTEKTLASTYSQAEKLADLAESVNGVNMVGYMKRFAVTFQKAKHVLEDGVLGGVESFEAYAYSSDFAYLEGVSKAGGSRGGVLGDLGSHIVDLSLWFFGDIQIESSSIESVTSLGSEDHAHFTVEGSGGVDGVFDVSWCKKGYRMPEFGLAIKGRKGSLTVNDDEVALRLETESKKYYRQDLNDNVDFLIGGAEYFREDNAFVESLLSGKVVEPSFRTASRVERLLEQVKLRAD